MDTKQSLNLSIVHESDVHSVEIKLIMRYNEATLGETQSATEQRYKDQQSDLTTETTPEWRKEPYNTTTQSKT
jgi:hypothetical protein